MPQKKKQTNNSHIHYFDDLEQGSPEWLKARENKISGSTAYKLFAKNLPKLSSFNVESNFKGNFFTERGHLLEEEAIELYQRIRDVQVNHTGLVTNDKYPNCIYSPDGFLDDRTIEVKCFMPARHRETIEYPDTKIISQIQFGQVIMEKSQTDLILYCPKEEIPLDQKLVITNFEANPKIHDRIKLKVKEINDSERKV